MKQQRGFTLVEIMIVVAIIAVLASIAIPSFMQSRSSARASSCVNNLRLQSGRPIVTGHTIHVVDLQDGGGWDWAQGEPPKTSPAYYLRFCKSFARMGGRMEYAQCDNGVFLRHLLRELSNP